MCDIFTQKDVHNVLQGKRFLFIGDSIMRNMYKDLVWLTTHPREEFLKTRFMQKKGEPHLGGLKSEKLIHNSRLTAGRDYEEVREYYDQTWGIQYSFYFITRCWSDKLYRFLETYPQEYGSYPDVIMINSVSRLYLHTFVFCCL